MNRTTDLIFGKLPMCAKGYKHIIATIDDTGLLSLSTTNTEKGKFFIAVSESNSIFSILNQNGTLVIHKKELFERYGIAFVDFNTIPK